MEEIDVSVTRHGHNIFLFELCSDAAREWVNEHVDEPLYFGSSIAVDQHFAAPLARGMADDGLVVE